jgi:hypothetical protein
MALQFPTLTMQHNQCESGALFYAEQVNGQTNRVFLVTKEKTKHLDNFQAWMKVRRLTSQHSTYPRLFSWPG